MISLCTSPEGFRTLRYGGPGGSFLVYLAQLLKVDVVDLNRGMFPGSSIKFLRNTQLRGVFLTDWRIESVDSLLEMPKLEMLALCTPCLKKFDIRSLTGLTYLSIDFSKAVTGVSACTRLRNLYLGEYNADNLSELSTLKDLASLQLVAPRIEDLTRAGFPKLTKLELKNTKHLKTLNGIQEELRLQYVCINQAPELTSLAGLEMLADLKTLIMIDCGNLDSLLPLTSCKNLEHLVMVGNTKIADGQVSVLTSLPNLRRLDFVEYPAYDMSLAALIDKIHG